MLKRIKISQVKPTEVIKFWSLSKGVCLLPYRVSILKAHFNLSYHNFECFYCPRFYDEIRSSQEVGKSVKDRYMIFKADYFQDTFKASSIQDICIYVYI